MIKQQIYYCVFLGLIFSIISCSPAISQAKKDKGIAYEENISSYRIKYQDSSSTKEISLPKNKPDIAPQNDVTKTLNQRLDTLARRNAGNKYVQGFRILVYSGKNSEEVRAVKTKVYEVLPDVNIYPEFKSPNQRLKAGDCIDRVEAYALLGKLKQHFPNAVIIPDQVIIKSK